MAQSPYHRLWNPAVGIVFAPTSDVVYPRLDLSKEFHNLPAIAAKGQNPEGTSSLDSSRSHEPAQSAMHAVAEAANVATVSNIPRSVSAPPQASSSNPADTEESAASQTPPVTDLEYRIDEEAFRKAKQATPGSPESYWSYTLYRGPEEDGAPRKIKVHYCKSKHTMERVCQYFLGEEVLGFDLEWVADSNRHAGPRRNVSLVQMASQSRIALFHVALFAKDDFVAPTFRRIMEDSAVSKVGVAIKADCTRLRNYLGVDTKGIFELSHLYKLVKYSATREVNLIDKRLVTLATQVKEFLHLPLFKGQDVRSSDWTQPLNMDQIVYSASDAYAGLQLYHILEQRRQELNPCPPRPFHAELGLPIRLAQGDSASSSEDGVEDAELVETEDAIAASTTTSTSFITTVRETLQVEVDEASESITGTGSHTKMPRSIIKMAPSPNKDRRIVEAEKWLADYRACRAGIRATPSALRAYRIWRSNDDLNPAGVAALLRQPPLQTNTVASYILEAIRLERLSFDSMRLRNEVFSQLPKEVLEGRYKTVSRMLEQAERAKLKTEHAPGANAPDSPKQ